MSYLFYLRAEHSGFVKHTVPPKILHESLAISCTLSDQSRRKQQWNQLMMRKTFWNHEKNWKHLLWLVWGLWGWTSLMEKQQFFINQVPTFSYSCWATGFAGWRLVMSWTIVFNYRHTCLDWDLDCLLAVSSGWSTFLEKSFGALCSVAGCIICRPSFMEWLKFSESHRTPVYFL